MPPQKTGTDHLSPWAFVKKATERQKTQKKNPFAQFAGTPPSCQTHQDPLPPQPHRHRRLRRRGPPRWAAAPSSAEVCPLCDRRAPPRPHIPFHLTPAAEPRARHGPAVGAPPRPPRRVAPRSVRGGSDTRRPPARPPTRPARPPVLRRPRAAGAPARWRRRGPLRLTTVVAAPAPRSSQPAPPLIPAQQASHARRRGQRDVPGAVCAAAATCGLRVLLARRPRATAVRGAAAEGGAADEGESRPRAAAQRPPVGRRRRRQPRQRHGDRCSQPTPPAAAAARRDTRCRGDPTACVATRRRVHGCRRQGRLPHTPSPPPRLPVGPLPAAAAIRRRRRRRRRTRCHVLGSGGAAAAVPPRPTPSAARPRPRAGGWGVHRRRTPAPRRNAPPPRCRSVAVAAPSRPRQRAAGVCPRRSSRPTAGASPCAAAVCTSPLPPRRTPHP